MPAPPGGAAAEVGGANPGAVQRSIGLAVSGGAPWLDDADKKGMIAALEAEQFEKTDGREGWG